MLKQLEFQRPVSKVLPTLRSEVNRGLDQIGGKYALSWQVLLVSYAWTAFISIAFDGTRFDTSALGWFVASSVAHVALIVVAIFFRSIALPVTNRKSKPAIALFAFAIMGLTRSTVVGQMAVYLDLAPTNEFGFRQVAGLFSITSGLSITVILVTAIAQRQNSLRDLINERHQLSGIKSQSESLFEEKRQEVLAIIDESIKPSLLEINQTLATENRLAPEVTQQTTSLISDLIESRLRPISDALHSPQAFLKDDRDWDVARKPLVRRTSKISVQRMFSPLMMSFLMSAVTISGTIYFAGFTAALIGPLVYIPFFAITWIAKQLIPENWKVNIWLALPITALAHIGAAYPTIEIISWLANYYPEIEIQIPTVLFGLTIVSVAVALLRGMQAERQNFENELRAANEEAATILTTLNQRIWVDRKNVAQLLHGTVQASLTAANVRLHQGKLTPEDLIKVREDISRALESLTAQSDSNLDLEEALEDLIDLWEGVCDIDLSISPETLQTLNQDSTAVHCSNEFIKECVNNAIKHGKASQIDIQIKLTQDRHAQIQVTNNGKVGQLSVAGLGTRILDEISLSWDRTQSQEGTTVVGLIGIAPVLP